MKYIFGFLNFPFVKALLISGTLTFLIAGAVFRSVDGTDIDVEKLIINPTPTIIFDKNGNPIAQFHPEKRYLASYDEIPSEIIEALVATEDRNFFNHSGISVKGIARAAVAIAKSDGELVQGGSTITQQLVKQIYLHSGKTLDRKKQEAVLATVLEEKYTKEQIVSFYLNHVFFGHSSYGVEDAIMTYFNQTMEEFNNDDEVNRIAKAALIAGIPQAPSRLSPYLNPEEAMEKRNRVIKNMWQEGYITTDQYNKAIKKDFLVLPEANVVHDDEIVDYPEIVHYVLEEAKDTLDLDDLGAVMNSGAKIYTSFDPEMYEHIRKEFARDELHPRNARDGTKTESSAVFLNPQNGEIYALVGRRYGDNKFLDFNPAFQMKRSPGSTIKPVVAYGPAIETGKFHPWSLVASRSGTCFSSSWCVKGGNSSSFAPMHQAFSSSYNVSAVWLLERVGINYARDYAEKLGLPLSEKDIYLPIALGALETGVNPLQMADSYQAFANGGYRTPAHMIRRIVANDGETILHSAEEKLNRVISEKSASYMKYMMRGTVTHGTGRNANVPGHFIAGKTGTNEVPWKGSSGNKDIWFVGFSKDIVGAIWMGFEHTDEEHFMYEYSSVPAKMFGEIMKPLMEEYPDPIENYKQPTVIKPEINKFNLKGSLQKEKRQVNLSWQSQKDAFYEVWRDNEKIAETEETSFIDTAVEEGKSYTYKILAFNSFSDFQTFESNVTSIEIPKPKEKQIEEENKEEKEKKEEEKPESEQEMEKDPEPEQEIEEEESEPDQKVEEETIKDSEEDNAANEKIEE